MNNNNIVFSPKVASAFVKFQALVRPIKKTKTVDAGGYTYAYCELSAMVEAIQEPMSACGLSFYQKVFTTEDRVSVTTYLLHESGEYIEGGEFSLKIKDQHPQKMGALLSFCRRYSLQTACSLTVCSEDTEPVVTKKKNLDAFKALAKENTQHEARVKELRRFMAICKSKNVTSDDDIHAIIYRYTSERTERRRDLKVSELLTLNTLLENCSADEVSRIIDSVRGKMAETA